MRVCLVLALGLLALSQTGCGREPIDTMTIYSLDAKSDDPSYKLPPGVEKFYGWAVLGKVDVTEPGDRESVLKAIEKGIEDGDVMAKCFWPRHAVRLTRGGKTTDYVICFECRQLDKYVNNEHQSNVATSRSPAEALNEHLQRAGVPQQESPF